MPNFASCLIFKPKISMWKEILFALIFSCSSIAFSQKAKVSGSVYDSEGLAVAFAIVHEKNTSNATTADENGKYVLNLDFGQTTIVFSNVGYIKQEVKINVDQDEMQAQKVILEPDPETSLTETTIIAKSNISLLKESGFNVVAIDAKPFHNVAINITELLDQVPGVKIQQEGGLGSRTNITINGLSGNHVRVFIDGMPMDAMSSAFQLNNIPVNLADRIEVYKGVVPVSFASDALGGAINIVTKKSKGSYLDASYSYGSFNTHQTFINAGYTARSGYTAQLSAYQNYSDNSYYVDDVKVLDFETNLYTDPQRVKRFHDNYHNETVIFKTGLLDKSFADQLLVGLTLGQEYTEVQHAAYILTVYGEKYYTSNTIMPSLLYSKKDFIIENLDVSIAGNYNFGEGHNVDTSFYQYNWLGQKRLTNSKGEFSAADYRYKDNNGTINANLSYEPYENQRLTVNWVSNYFSRVGDNSLDVDDEMNQYPRVNNRRILGIGWNSDINEKLSLGVFSKRYFYHASAFINLNTANVADFQMVKKEDSKWGYGITGAYFLNNNLQLKANYELTCRMPTSEELFGVVFYSYQENYHLLPETSNNINVGLNYNKHLNNNKFLSTEVNLFYRHTKDFIKRTASARTNQISYENISLVRNPGVDAEVRYSQGKKFTCGANLSYQRPMKYDPENDPTQINAVVPNQPNFFGNADATYMLNDVWLPNSRLSIRYALRFVKGFFNEWDTYASADKMPTQWSHDIGAVYSLQNGKYNISLDCKNMFDAKLYDNFSLQKPGRSFSVKVRYFINKR